MTRFDEIYGIAIGNYGLVTAAQARGQGVTSVELSGWCKIGRLTRRGQGVYKLDRWVPTPYDGYAEALALVGEGSYLKGTAVLSLHNLALVDPRTIKVATPKRVRRKLPLWISIVAPNEADRVTCYEGIRSQSVADAIRECASCVMRGRLLATVEDAQREGLITATEHDELQKELARQKHRIN